MKKTFEGLLRLREIDKKLDLLESRIADGPRILEKRALEFKKEQETVESKKEYIQSLKLASKDKEVELRSREEEITKQEMHLLAAKTNQEYSTIQGQIERLKGEVSVFEEAILESYDLVEEENRELAGVIRELGIQEKELEEFRRGVEKEMGEYNTEIEEYQAKRQALVDSVDFEAVQLYDRVKSARGGEAIVDVIGKNCGGCHMSITPNDLARLHGGHEIVSCKYCQRILYLAD